MVATCSYHGKRTDDPMSTQQSKVYGNLRTLLSPTLWNQPSDSFDHSFAYEHTTAQREGVNITTAVTHKI